MGLALHQRMWALVIVVSVALSCGTPDVRAQPSQASPRCDSLSARYDRTVKERPFDPRVGLPIDSQPVPKRGWEEALRSVVDAAGASLDRSHVRVSFYVTEQGQAACVLGWSASRGSFDDGPIVEALEALEFEPARISGEAVLVRWSVRLPYSRE